MKILYDHQIFSIQRVGGISKYFVELIQNLPIEILRDISIGMSDNIYLPTYKPVISLPSFKGVHRICNLFNEPISLYQLNKKYDVFHPTYYDPYFLHRKHPRYVITVHDMIHEKFQQLFSYRDKTIEQKRATILNADKIIAISENTKKDLLDIYGINNPEKIRVIHHGIAINRTTTPVNNLPRNYILFVGARGGYKNFENFCRAYASVVRNYKEIQLVCTGRDFTPVEIEFLKKTGIHNNVHHYLVSDEQLRYLYKNALCFVYPSLYEGFGLPILEAFMMECPVILSHSSCFPEIAGDCAVYFDPTDVDSMQSAIEKVLNDSVLRQELSQRGKIKLGNYTIDNMVSKTLNVYRELC